MRKIERSTLMFSLGTILGVALLGCSRSNMDCGPAFASAETRGEIVYERNCSACHDAENLQLLKQPPKLKGLFDRKTLPSGAPATNDQVRKNHSCWPGNHAAVRTHLGQTASGRSSEVSAQVLMG